MPKQPAIPTIPIPDFRVRTKVSKAKSQASDLPVKTIIFDVDGVLVDVRGSFHRTTLETVRFFTRKRVTRQELQQWKSRSGFNDDWKLSTAWVQSLGGNYSYDEVKRKFVELYWGRNGRTGNVAHEKWLLTRAALRRLARRYELALFTGRVRRELDYTLDRNRVREFFGGVVTAEDVSRPKPDPEGILKILAGRDPQTVVYVGDNIDDAIAARSAEVSFVGIVAAHGHAQRERSAALRQHGAAVILSHVREIEPWLERFDVLPLPRTSGLQKG